MKKNILLDWWNRTSADREAINLPDGPESSQSRRTHETEAEGEDLPERSGTSLKEEAAGGDESHYAYPGRPAERKKMDANLYRALSG